MTPPSHRPENIEGMACIRLGGPINDRANARMERGRVKGARGLYAIIGQLEQRVFPIKSTEKNKRINRKL